MHGQNGRGEQTRSGTVLLVPTKSPKNHHVWPTTTTNSLMFDARTCNRPVAGAAGPSMLVSISSKSMFRSKN